MNILMLNHNVVNIGTFNRCYYFAKALVTRGHSVTIVTNSPSKRFSFYSYRNRSVEIIESPDLFFGSLRSGWDPVNALRRFLKLAKHKFDVIHAFECRPTVIFPALQLKKLWNCAFVSDWCDWWGRGGAITLREPRWLNQAFEPVETFFEEHFRKYADHITTISEPLRQRAIRLGMHSDKVTVVSPVADIENMYPMDKESARRKIGINVRGNVLIFSSYVHYDADFLLDAFELVCERFPDTVLLATGKNIKNTKRFKDKIIHTGYVSLDLVRMYIGAADLCLLPLSDHVANRARFPDKLRNYLSCGRPVVGTNVGHTGETLNSLQVGFTSEPNVKAYAEAIIKALENRDQFSIWGQNARRAAETVFSGEEAGRILDSIYREEAVKAEELLVH